MNKDLIISNRKLGPYNYKIYYIKRYLKLDRIQASKYYYLDNSNGEYSALCSIWNLLRKKYINDDKIKNLYDFKKYAPDGYSIEHGCVLYIYELFKRKYKRI